MLLVREIMDRVINLKMGSQPSAPEEDPAYIPALPSNILVAREGVARNCLEPANSETAVVAAVERFGARRLHVQIWKTADDQMVLSSTPNIAGVGLIESHALSEIVEWGGVDTAQTPPLSLARLFAIIRKRKQWAGVMLIIEIMCQGCATALSKLVLQNDNNRSVLCVLSRHLAFTFGVTGVPTARIASLNEVRLKVSPFTTCYHKYVLYEFEHVLLTDTDLLRELQYQSHFHSIGIWDVPTHGSAVLVDMVRIAQERNFKIVIPASCTFELTSESTDLD